MRRVFDALAEKPAEDLIVLGVPAALLFRPQAGPEPISVLAVAVRTAVA